jgi:long-chain acyl-CoA synthetase
MFFRRAAEFADRPRYRAHRNGTWSEVRWRDVEQSVREIAAGLIDLGLKPGERAAIFAGTSPSWIEADLGIQSAGGVTIPIYQSNLANEAGFIVLDSEARVAFCDGPKTLARLREAIAHGVELDDGSHAAVQVGRIILFDGEPDGPDAMTLEQLRVRGRANAEALAEMNRRIDSLARDQVATIVYTSGTTGSPKGVVQSHHNHLSMLEMSAELGLVRPGEVDFFFLPLAHSFARMIAYYGLYVGSVTAFARSIDTLAHDIGETHPHVIPAVPRIYEKIYARIQATAEAGGGLKKQIFDWALQVGRRRSAHLQARETPPMLLEMEYWVADRLVFKRIRDLLGGNVRIMISGASPLAREIMEFFHAADLLILEGYGLTETTPALTINRPDAFKFGTVGLAFDEVELRIAADGEILCRGPNVALGYYKRPEATAEAWDAEGWFHTGDIGEMDAEGFLRITDRKKDLIKTSGGKYVAPQKIENLLKTQAHISQAVVIGDNRKYCTALLTLDPDAVPHLAERAGCPPEPSVVASNPNVLKIIEDEIAQVNQKLASFESIKYFRVLPAELSEQAGELTPSLKIKRKVVASRYAPLIDEMYR